MIFLKLIKILLRNEKEAADELIEINAKKLADKKASTSRIN
jgi:hypothetical protein